MNVEYKVSGTGWLCQRINGGDWYPVTKLTASQMNDVYKSLE